MPSNLDYYNMVIRSMMMRRDGLEPIRQGDLPPLPPPEYGYLPMPRPVPGVGILGNPTDTNPFSGTPGIPYRWTGPSYLATDPVTTWIEPFIYDDTRPKPKPTPYLPPLPDIIKPKPNPRLDWMNPWDRLRPIPPRSPGSTRSANNFGFYQSVALNRLPHHIANIPDGVDGGGELDP